MEEQKAREALQELIAACEEIVACQYKGQAHQLLRMVETLDKYLTGRGPDRSMFIGDAMQLVNCAPWTVYLSDEGYTRMIIDPMSKKLNVWLTYGGGAPHPGFAEKLRKFRKLLEEPT